MEQKNEYRIGSVAVSLRPSHDSNMQKLYVVMMLESCIFLKSIPSISDSELKYSNILHSYTRIYNTEACI